MTKDTGFGGPDLSTASEEAVQYARHLFDTVVDWYKTADNKAQILLSLNGAFLAFIVGLVFTTSAGSTATQARFSILTWLFLGISATSLVGALGCSLICLYSRTYHKRELLKILDQNLPSNTFFFQIIASTPYSEFDARLRSADFGFELQALAWEIWELSKNVTQKHSWVNRSFVLTVVSLLSFLGAGITYLFR